VDRLRIVVGFKVTPDYEALRASDWARAAGGAAAGGGAAEGGGPPAGPETRYVRRVLGVFDEAALELALRLRDARAEGGLETSLAAFSVASREADPFLMTLQALGFERAARVDPGPDLDFAPFATAALVAACAERLGGDVLLLGSGSGPGDSGVVPFLAAEALGRPCLTQVTELEPKHDGRLRATFTADDGPVRATVAPPCVLAVGNALVSMLRVPTLRDRLAVKDAPVVELTASELGVDLRGALADEPGRLAGLETIDRSRPGAVVAGATPADKARALYETHLRARLESL
jgi:electron transfer flavoprotein beta subunit